MHEIYRAPCGRYGLVRASPPLSGSASRAGFRSGVDHAVQTGNPGASGRTHGHGAIHISGRALQREGDYVEISDRVGLWDFAVAAFRWTSVDRKRPLRYRREGRGESDGCGDEADAAVAARRAIQAHDASRNEGD